MMCSFTPDMAAVDGENKLSSCCFRPPWRVWCLVQSVVSRTTCLLANLSPSSAPQDRSLSLRPLCIGSLC